jgi:hypothetical protein
MTETTIDKHNIEEAKKFFNRLTAVSVTKIYKEYKPVNQVERNVERVANR